MVNTYFIFIFEELPDCFPKWLYYFMFLPAVCEEGSSHTLANTYYLCFDYGLLSCYIYVSAALLWFLLEG